MFKGFKMAVKPKMHSAMYILCCEQSALVLHGKSPKLSNKKKGMLLKGNILSCKEKLEK